MKSTTRLLFVLGAAMFVMCFAHSARADTSFVGGPMAASFSSVSSMSCTFGSNPAQNSVVSIDFFYYPTSVTVTSVSDNLGNGAYGVVESETSSGGTTNIVGYVYSGWQSHSPGTTTVTVYLSSTITYGMIDCMNWGSLDIVAISATQVSTGSMPTAVNTGKTVTVASFTPIAHDAVYAVGAFQVCGGLGSVYDSPATSFTGYTADGFTNPGLVAQADSCATSKYTQLAGYDEYWVPATASATTVSTVLESGSSARTSGTGEYVFLVVEFRYAVTLPVSCSMGTPTPPDTSAPTVYGPSVLGSGNSVTCNGGTTNFLMGTGDYVLLTENSAPGGLRYQFPVSSAPSSTTTTYACAGTPPVTCSKWSVVSYEQESNTYSATLTGTGTNYPNWAGSNPAPTDTSVGVASSISIPISGGTSGSTTGWTDYNTAVGSFPNPGYTSGSTGRYESPSTCTVNSGSAITTHGSTYSCAYYNQGYTTYELDAQPSGNIFNTPLNAVAMPGYSFGSSVTICQVTITAASSDSCGPAWTDLYNTEAPPTTTLTGSGLPAGSRWYCSASQTNDYCASFANAPSNYGATRHYYYYKQWDAPFQITDYVGPASFDGSMTAVPVTAYQNGASATVCSIAPSGSSATCGPEYVDADSTNVPTIPYSIGGAPSNTRWECAQSGTCPYAATTSASTYNLNFYKQLAETWTASAANPSAFDVTAATATVTGNSLGSSTALCGPISTTATVATATCAGYIDYNSAATFQTNMTAPLTKTEWQCATCVTSAQTSSGNTPTIYYYEQLRERYTAVPYNPLTFSASITFLVTGTYKSSAGTTLCTVTVPASPAASTGYTCVGHPDYNTAVTFAAYSTSNPSNVRWGSLGPWNPVTDITAGNQRYDNYVEQVQNTFTGTPVSPTTWDSDGKTILFKGVQLGVLQTIATFSIAGGASAITWTGYTDYNQYVGFRASTGGTGYWIPSIQMTASPVTGTGSTYNADYSLIPASTTTTSTSTTTTSTTKSTTITQTSTTSTTTTSLSTTTSTTTTVSPTTTTGTVTSTTIQSTTTTETSTETQNFTTTFTTVQTLTIPTTLTSTQTLVLTTTYTTSLNGTLTTVTQTTTSISAVTSTSTITTPTTIAMTVTEENFQNTAAQPTTTSTRSAPARLPLSNSEVLGIVVIAVLALVFMFARWGRSQEETQSQKATRVLGKTPQMQRVDVRRKKKGEK